MKEEISKVNFESNKWLLCDMKITRFFLFQDFQPKIRLVFLIIKLFASLLILFGFIKIVYFYLKQPLSGRLDSENIPDHIVIKTLGRHHHENYFNFYNKNKNSDYLLFNGFNSNEFTNIKRLAFHNIFNSFIRNSKEMLAVLNENISEEINTLVVCNTIKNLATYSYYCALFRSLKAKNPKLTLFQGGAELISHAANKEKVSTYWLTHGLIDPICHKNIPEYDYIYVYSKEELNYLNSLPIKSKIKVYSFNKIEDRQNKVIFFLGYEERSTDIEQGYLKDIVNLFQSHNFEILVKPHPVSDSNLEKKLPNHQKIKICREKINTVELLQREKPSFSVSSISTSVCESLQSGVIPICYAEINGPFRSYLFFHPSECPYPYEKRALFWEKESQKIISLLKNIDDYSVLLENLRNR